MKKRPIVNGQKIAGFMPPFIRALREPLVNVEGFAFYADDAICVLDCFTGKPISWRWKVSTLAQLYMPYEAIRTFTTYEKVWAERVQEISEEDAKAEGAPPGDRGSYVAGFYFLWESINHDRGHEWNKNEWVWAVKFRRLIYATITAAETRKA